MLFNGEVGRRAADANVAPTGLILRSRAPPFLLFTGVASGCIPIVATDGRSGRGNWVRSTLPGVAAFLADEAHVLVKAGHAPTPALGTEIHFHFVAVHRVPLPRRTWPVPRFHSPPPLATAHIWTPTHPKANFNKYDNDVVEL